MVTLRQEDLRSADGRFDGTAWLDRICGADSRLDRVLLQRALAFVQQHNGKDDEIVRSGIEFASLMAELRMDTTSIAAGLVYRCVRSGHVTTVTLEREVDGEVAHLVADVERVGTVSLLDQASLSGNIAQSGGGAYVQARDARLDVYGADLHLRVPRAGHVWLAASHIEAHYRVDPELFSPRADYLLRVAGLSMRDAGIQDGDLLAVHSAAEARSGQIVVARLSGASGDEVTVKRLKRRGRDILLLPENPDFAPIVVDPRHTAFAIEGVAVGIVRRNGGW